jgi:glycerate 2-kinase
MSKLLQAARELQKAALEAVEPAAAVRRYLQRNGSMLQVSGRAYDLTQYRHVYLLGVGKAAVPMAAAAADILADCLTTGVVLTKYGHAEASARALPDSIQVIEAGHPVPDVNCLRGARAIVDLAQKAGEADLVVCLISGGGSALLTLPAGDLSLAELQQLTETLLRSGATIGEMNTVRKHLSAIKGGNLARLVSPAALVGLVLSDVIGDPLEVIASGPTAPDPTTVEDARRALARYGVPLADWEPHLRETPKPGDPIFETVQHVIVGSNRQAALAAAERARQLGYHTSPLGSFLEGEAREVGKVAAGLAKAVRAHGDPVPPPACLILGGETTVTVLGDGRGGRNQELALSAAIALAGWPEVLLMALATDGGDGPTDAAGAIVTGDTVGRAQALGLNPHAALARNDSYPFFEALGDLIQTGPTGTNVNDLLFVLVGESAEAGRSPDASQAG